VLPAVTGAGSALTAGSTMFLGYQGSGTVSVGSGGTVSVGGKLELGSLASGGGLFNLNGTVSVGSGGTVSVGGKLELGSLASAGGTLKVTGADLTSSVPMSLTNLSLIDTSGMSATLSGTLSGSGGLAKNGAGILHLTGANNYTGGTAIFAGTVAVPSSLALGSGDVDLAGGVLQATGDFTRDAEVTVDGAGSVLSAANLQIGVGGTGALLITNGGTVTTPGAFSLAVLPGGTSGFASVTGAGSTLSVGGALTVGIGASSSGSVNVGAGGVINASSVVLGDGGSGAFHLNPGGQLNVGGANALATPGPVSVFDFAGGVLKVTGSSLTTNARIRLTNNTLIDTSGVSAALSGIITGSGGFAKTGAGTLTLAASNFYGGSTTVLAGTLALGASGALPGGSAIVLEGGTLDANGFSATTGTLDVNFDSTIDFDPGAVSLAFANSSALAWTGTLTITGFTVGADTLRFGTDATGLTAAQLALFRFADYADATGVIDAQGYVTIPEPGSAALLLAGAALLTRRRRK
jgi:T5SS/PEP-CTERM-associated repeat protein/autotransporter-associated beta strand protein